MQIHPSTKKLIDRLYDMTLERKIEWKPGADGAVVYDTERYSVTLTGNPTEVILCSDSERWVPVSLIGHSNAILIIACLRLCSHVLLYLAVSSCGLHVLNVCMLRLGLAQLIIIQMTSKQETIIQVATY